MNNEKNSRARRRNLQKRSGFWRSQKFANFVALRWILTALVIAALLAIPVAATNSNNSPLKVEFKSYGSYTQVNVAAGQNATRASDFYINLRFEPIAEYCSKYLSLIPIGVIEMQSGTRYGYALICMQDVEASITATNTTLAGRVYWYTKYGTQPPAVGYTDAVDTRSITWRKVWKTATVNGAGFSTPTASVTPVTGVGSADLASDMVADAERCAQYNNLYTQQQYDTYGQMRYTAGVEAGYNDGYDDGFERGEQMGWEQGYYTGTEEGYETGYADGYETGFAYGYETGYAEGIASVPPVPPTEGDTVVLDIPQIITSVPQAIRNMFDSAFNLTLFAGTPQAINIGQIFAVLLGLAAVVAVITIILKKVF